MFITKLFDRSFDPARARRLPIRSEAGESNVRGLGAADRCQELGLRYVVIEQLRQQRPAHDRRKGAGLKAVS